MVAIITAVVLFLCVPVGAVIYTILTFDIKRNWKKCSKRCIFLEVMHVLNKYIPKIFSVLIFDVRNKFSSRPAKLLSFQRRTKWTVFVDCPHSRPTLSSTRASDVVHVCIYSILMFVWEKTVILVERFRFNFRSMFCFWFV